MTWDQEVKEKAVPIAIQQARDSLPSIEPFCRCCRYFTNRLVYLIVGEPIAEVCDSMMAGDWYWLKVKIPIKCLKCQQERTLAHLSKWSSNTHKQLPVETKDLPVYWVGDMWDSFELARKSGFAAEAESDQPIIISGDTK